MQLTESRLNRRRHVRWSLPCASNHRTRQIFKHSPCAYHQGTRQKLFFAVCHTVRRARRRNGTGHPFPFLCRVPPTREHGKGLPLCRVPPKKGTQQRPFGLTKWSPLPPRKHRLHTAKGTPSFFMFIFLLIPAFKAIYIHNSSKHSQISSYITIYLHIIIAGVTISS
jgi:hypothetical protein